MYQFHLNYIWSNWVGPSCALLLFCAQAWHGKTLSSRNDPIFFCSLHWRNLSLYNKITTTHFKQIRFWWKNVIKFRGKVYSNFFKFVQQLFFLSVCLHRQIFINLNESNLISDSQSSVYMNTNLCNQGRTGAKKRPWTFFFFLNESVLSLIRIFIIVSLLKYSKYTVWTWTLHRAYFHVIITFKYIVPKSEIKTVLYLNVKNCT